MAHGCLKPRDGTKRFCPRHRHRYDKANRPIYYTYQILRNNAKKRGKEFSITLDEFREFCIETGYMQLKGRMATSATIDRIDPTKGYEKGNIRILSNEANGRKGATEDKNCPF